MNQQTKANSNENTLLVAALLDIGEMLLVSGAEVSRVEDTMERLGKAYRFNRVDIFSITSSIVLTVQAENGEVITQTRRIRSTQVDMEKIVHINALSRDLCLSPKGVEDLQKCITDISGTKKYPALVKLLAYPLISGPLTVFFGGSLIDAAASLISGLFLSIIIALGYKMKMQSLVLYLLCSFVTGLAVILLINLGIGASFDKIIIGNIMLLIPGISLTTSLRDMIRGDLITGLLGLCEALLKAFAIAVGFGTVMIMIGL